MNDLTIERGFGTLHENTRHPERHAGHFAEEQTGRRGWPAETGVHLRHQELIGGTQRAEPLTWRLDKTERLPPFVSAMLGLPLMPVRTFDVAPESKTWSCSPDPLVLFVTWDDGGTEEFYRFQDQSFHAFRWTHPNTGETTARFAYNARLVASGAGKSAPDITGQLRFEIAVRNAAGAPFWFSGNNFWVQCRDNRLMGFGDKIDPGLYDLIAGASWDIKAYYGARVHRC